MNEQELRDFLERVETAMRAEGCAVEQVQRVQNWLIYGQPLGADAVISAYDIKAEVRPPVFDMVFDMDDIPPESLSEAWAAITEGFETRGDST